MPTVKRGKRPKLTPREKVVKDAEKVIESLHEAQALYDEGRKSGKITEPNPFFEP